MINEAASVTARRIAAIPARTSTETWRAIVDLLAEPGSAAHQELAAITNVAAILISEEYTREAPIVIQPTSGTRIRVRTVHGMDALEAINDESPLYSGRLSEPGWTMSLPCGPNDLQEMAAALAATPAITVRDTSEGFNTPATQTTAGRASTSAPIINLSEMKP